MDGNKVLSSAALAAFLATAAFGLAAENIIECLWTREPVTIDGVAQDWDDATPVTDPGSKVQYALKSDNRNLYIITVFRDQMSRTTFDYTGMKIYFTTGAKKNKDFGINFQKKQYTAEALIANMEKRGQALTEEQKAEIRKKPNHVVFTEEPIKPKKAVIEIDPAVTVEPPIFRTIEKGQLSVCEFRIPLSRINQVGIGAEPGQQIMLGFEWGGMNSQIMKDMLAGRADRSVAASERGTSIESGLRDSSGDGTGGFDTRPGQIPASEYNRDPRFKKHEFWIQAKLAAKPAAEEQPRIVLRRSLD